MVLELPFEVVEGSENGFGHRAVPSLVQKVTKVLAPFYIVEIDVSIPQGPREQGCDVVVTDWLEGINESHTTRQDEGGRGQDTRA
jgi:hypothetical protein